MSDESKNDLLPMNVSGQSNLPNRSGMHHHRTAEDGTMSVSIRDRKMFSDVQFDWQSKLDVKMPDGRRFQVKASVHDGETDPKVDVTEINDKGPVNAFKKLLSGGVISGTTVQHHVSTDMQLAADVRKAAQAAISGDFSGVKQVGETLEQRLPPKAAGGHAK